MIGMSWRRSRPRLHRLAFGRAVLLALVIAAPTGCGLLDVNNPTAVEDQDLQDASGAELLREGALRTLANMVLGAAFNSGLVADEFLVIAPLIGNDLLDRRASAELLQGATSPGGYATAQEVRAAASIALLKLRQYAPAGAEAHVGEVYAARALAAVVLASNFCPGFPLREVAGFQPVYGPPLSTDEVLERALADYDSALTYVADSARVLNFARVGRARTLLLLGRYAEAASAVSDVPTNYVYRAEYKSGVTLTNNMAVTSNSFQNALFFGFSVADNEGGNGLDFVSAKDPRLPTISLTPKLGRPRYGANKYPTLETPIVVVGGIEARLIEAEAALRANPNNLQWLTILNTLRTNGTRNSSGVYNAGTGGVAGLAPLGDPGTEAARVNLVFRERAFWLFGTSTRLADLRRLIRQYSREPESVFPTGPYLSGGAYGTATSIPFRAEDEAPFNPAVTGCTSS